MRTSVMAGILAVFSLAALFAAIIWNVGGGEETQAVGAVMVVPNIHELPRNPLLAEAEQPAAPAINLPTHPDPLSPRFALLVDGNLSTSERTRQLTDGSIPFVEQPQDVVLIRRIILDPSESDTLRNEAANLLARSQVAERHDDYLAVIDNLAGEGYRFRSFAVQHLALDWREGALTDAQAPVVLNRLRELANDKAEHPAVRREAIWPLAQKGDPQTLALAEELIQDPEATWVHDLCCRIAELYQRQDWRDALHAIATRPQDEREAPADSNCCGGSSDPGLDPAAIVEPNRLAALRALVALNDATGQRDTVRRAKPAER